MTHQQEIDIFIKNNNDELNLKLQVHHIKNDDGCKYHEFKSC